MNQLLRYTSCANSHSNTRMAAGQSFSFQSRIFWRPSAAACLTIYCTTKLTRRPGTKMVLLTDLPSV